jgi:DedD protein
LVQYDFFVGGGHSLVDDGLKHRLVGAVVLVSIAVIFLPVLLDGDPDQYKDRHEFNLPEKPERTRVAVDLDTNPARSRLEHLADGEQRLQPAQKVVGIDLTAGSDQPAAPASPMAAHPGLKAWAIQLGSFASETNAYVLRDRLRKAGFSSFVQVVKVDSRDLFRVRVGPELDRKRAEIVRTEILSSVSLDGKLVTHP